MRILFVLLSVLALSGCGQEGVCDNLGNCDGSVDIPGVHTQ